MFSSAWNFVKRHKRKFIFTGALVGGNFITPWVISGGAAAGRRGAEDPAQRQRDRYYLVSS